MTMDYIRATYLVPAKVGGRIEYTGCGEVEHGTITGAEGARLRVRLDGHKHSAIFHPTWKMRYLDPAPKSCAAGRDGDCTHSQCPQSRDGEPHATGRHCPLDIGSEDE